MQNVEQVLSLSFLWEQSPNYTVVQKEKGENLAGVYILVHKENGEKSRRYQITADAVNYYRKRGINLAGVYIYVTSGQMRKAKEFYYS